MIITLAPERRVGAAGGSIVLARLLGQSVGALLAATAFRLLAVNQTRVLLIAAASIFALAACLSLIGGKSPDRT
ncbi:MAG TPA: hypothetical protein VF193_13025 [Steroidobacter sp.]